MATPGTTRKQGSGTRAGIAVKSVKATPKKTTMKKAPATRSSTVGNETVLSALRKRFDRAFAFSLENASAESLQRALEAPTDVGSAARLLSNVVGADMAVSTLDPLAAAVVRGAALKKDLAERAGGLLDTASVMDILDVSRQAIAKQVQRGKLLAVGGGTGKYLFPAVQFTASGVITGLPEVLAAFNVESPWSRLALLLDTDPSLGGRSVIEALSDGDLDAVLDVVRSFGE